jgi:hypothetical protein
MLNNSVGAFPARAGQTSSFPKQSSRNVHRRKAPRAPLSLSISEIHLVVHLLREDQAVLLIELLTFYLSLILGLSQATHSKKQ